MISRILYSYPARIVFLLTAITIAIAVITFRTLFMRSTALFRPKSRKLH